MSDTLARSTHPVFTKKQLVLKEVFVGTLIYAAVLGFCADYTEFVVAESFSTIFLASLVLELLTFATFSLKTHVLNWYRLRHGRLQVSSLIMLIWPIMFLSKFVFIWSVDRLFSGAITIEGFWGILIVVVSVTVVHKTADTVFVQLGRD